MADRIRTYAILNVADAGNPVCLDESSDNKASGDAVASQDVSVATGMTTIEEADPSTSGSGISESVQGSAESEAVAELAATPSSVTETDVTPAEHSLATADEPLDASRTTSVSEMSEEQTSADGKMEQATEEHAPVEPVALDSEETIVNAGSSVLGEDPQGKSWLVMRGTCAPIAVLCKEK